MTGKDRFLPSVYSVKSTEEAREFYDRWSEVYDEELTENSYRQPARCAEALRILCDPHNCSVLDVGCGSGLSGMALREAGFDIVDGCDFSTGMLAKAEKAGHYRRLFSTDLNEPPMDVADATYNAAACVGVFSFGHVSPDALDDILRVLHPGGALVIGLNDHFYREGSLSEKLRALEDDGRIRVFGTEHGEHIPGTGVTGWVISARKSH
ncbi:MAG: class I SAM-dependent methyltransferase [Oricola sp.]